MSIEKKIENTISQIDKELEQGNRVSNKELFQLVVGGYIIEIPNLSSGMPEDDEDYGFYADYRKYLFIIKERLEIYLSKYTDEKAHGSKELTQTHTPVNVNVNNTNTNSSDNHSTNTNNNTNTSTIDLKIMFEQARNTIENDDVLSEDEINEILDRINQLEELASSDENKRSKWNKCKETMTWLFDKGAKVAGTILPLITEIIK